MGKLSIAECPADRLAQWDAFIARSNEGTIFHKLDFLAYHGERFQKQIHNLIWYHGQQPFGLMPMAIFEEEFRIARTPYGGSFGGPVFERPLTYGESRETVETLLEYLTKLSIKSCQITLPLSCCYNEFSETFRLALLEQGFCCVNRDISSVVQLGTSNPREATMTSRARNAARVAVKHGVTFTQRGNVTDFWQVMEKTFEKHDANPTHTRDEFHWLCEHLPEQIYVDLAYLNSRPIAGIGYFVLNRRVNSSFYLCQDPEFQHTQALSGLICDALQRVQDDDYKWFDFGTSSVKMHGRENIFRFKEGFGAVGLFRDTYQWQG